MIYSFSKHTWGQVWAQTDLSESLWGILMKPWLSEYWWFGSGQTHLQIDFISQQSRSRRVHRPSSAQHKAWTQIHSISIVKQFIRSNVVFKHLSQLHQSCESSESDLDFFFSMPHFNQIAWDNRADSFCDIWVYGINLIVACLWSVRSYLDDLDVQNILMC